MTWQFLNYGRQGGVVTITLNRPPLNVLTIAMMEELTCAFISAGKEDCALVLLDAQGRAFCAGVDVGDHTEDKVEQMIDAFGRLLLTMAGLDKPLVAAVNGAALGGGWELVMTADLVVASSRAKFGQPEITVGVFPPLACYVLPRLLTWPKAMELLLGGGTIDAARAHELGLVNRVIAADDFAAGVNAFLEQFKSMSPVVLALTKKAARLGLNGDLAGGLSAINAVYLSELMSTEDAREGLKAFLEKRRPVWRGK